MYQKLIELAELEWLKKNHEEAVRYYKEALNHKQSGPITKKMVRENIKECEFEQMWHQHDNK